MSKLVNYGLANRIRITRVIIASPSTCPSSGATTVPSKSFIPVRPSL
ncbi:hypothetical protein KBC77_00260 [Candidatus Saccharibacteria bacterium]|nr:hypothetical protein [Candidatus Saccharibacteria bacterium]